MPVAHGGLAPCILVQRRRISVVAVCGLGLIRLVLELDELILVRRVREGRQHRLVLTLALALALTMLMLVLVEAALVRVWVWVVRRGVVRRRE